MEEWGHGGTTDHAGANAMVITVGGTGTDDCREYRGQAENDDSVV